MFYSHQLLARKAPLGQIWMAATMHAKINRRKLNNLNIIKICEEILNPSIPMALRLSGILMGGVVIVYERKVKLLYEDVTRLLVEINEAWKVKPARDPTILPKRKIQAKKEKITLPDKDNQETDVEFGDIESLIHDSNANSAMGFQHTAYFAMRLDNVDEHYVNDASKDDGGEFQNFHQADAANITLFEHFDSFQTNGHLFNHFERFDIEGEESNMNNTTTADCTQMPKLEESPPPLHEPQRADEIHDQHPEDQTNQPCDKNKETSEREQQQAPARKKARRVPAFRMDYEQTMIPGYVYQTWLQDTGDIVSKRGRKRKRENILSTMKIANLMELPPVVLICGLVKENREVHYPEPLMELWIRSNQPPHDSPSGRMSPPLPPEPSVSSPPHEASYNPVADGLPFGDFLSGVVSESYGSSVEKQRSPIKENIIPAEFLREEPRTNLMNNGLRMKEPSIMVTPGNSGDEVRSIPSAGSGYVFVPHNLEVSSLRSSKKRTTSSKHSSGGLETVRENSEENFFKPKFRLSSLSENGFTPEQELFVDTGPTQTPILRSTPHGDQLTESIKTQMKLHFETPGAPAIESINQLAVGMTRKGAALLFYQTCVLASLDVLKVEQKVPYADILICKGPKM